eukprot:jgi/Psemu1/319552/estExt_fgenesh1_pm.C_2470005
MIGPSSSLIVRWASGVLRERVAVLAATATPTSLFPTPFFQGFLNKNENKNCADPYRPYHPYLQPLLGDGASSSFSLEAHLELQQQQPPLNEHIWFAVPKSKISRSRKRMKNTRQKRIPLKKNIVFDPRTGEVTLQHKLPYNWKDYLPKVD